MYVCIRLLITVAVRSKSWACGRSHARVVGLNPAGSMDIWLLWALHVVRYRSVVGLIARLGESHRMWCVQWVWSRSPEKVAMGGGGFITLHCTTPRKTYLYIQCCENLTPEWGEQFLIVSAGYVRPTLIWNQNGHVFITKASIHKIFFFYYFLSLEMGFLVQWRLLVQSPK